MSRTLRQEQEGTESLHSFSQFCALLRAAVSGLSDAGTRAPALYSSSSDQFS